MSVKGYLTDISLYMHIDMVSSPVTFDCGYGPTRFFRRGKDKEVQLQIKKNSSKVRSYA